MQEELSPLQRVRIDFKPKLPPLLEKISEVCFTSETLVPISDERILSTFPHLSSQPVLHGAQGAADAHRALSVGIVFSGGQAPGGHNVISGLFDALNNMSQHSQLYGFLNGPSGIVDGKYKLLTKEEIYPYRNLGGFDLLGSGRTKIETEEQLSSSLKTAIALKLDALVIIGGDDSNTNAALLAEYFTAHGSKCTVVGVPKTIDGDLQNNYVPISFGFDSACRVYAELIGNIAKDALSARKYYHFIKLMGRSASHITVECALATRPNLALIGEEIATKRKTLKEVVMQIADVICKRAVEDKNYGVILIPEGLVEFIPEVSSLIKELSIILSKADNMTKQQAAAHLTPESKECFMSLPENIQDQLFFDRDPHGNVQLALIETEKLLSQMVMQELSERKSLGLYEGKFAPMHHYLGYEGRSGLPTNFDAHYCYALGFVAALLAKQRATGYMCFVANLHKPVSDWTFGGVPLVALMHTEMRKGKYTPVVKKALVDLSHPSFMSFIAKREAWMTNDCYLCPGPTQYFGPDEVSFLPPLLLLGK